MSSSHTVPRIDIPEAGQISTNKCKGMSGFTSISLNDLFEADLGANRSSWQHSVQRDLVRPQMGKFHMLGLGRKGTPWEGQEDFALGPQVTLLQWQKRKADPQNGHVSPQDGSSYEYILEAPNMLYKETIIHVHARKRTAPDLQPPTKVEQVAVMQ